MAEVLPGKNTVNLGVEIFSRMHRAVKSNRGGWRLIFQRPQSADRARNRREAFGSILVLPAEQPDLGSFFGIQESGYRRISLRKPILGS